LKARNKNAGEQRRSEHLLTVERLKADVLPALFVDTSSISQYGGAPGGAEAINEISDLMEGGSVGLLAKRIGEIVALLAEK
jgi:hypothetical protein